MNEAEWNMKNSADRRGPYQSNKDKIDNWDNKDNRDSIRDNKDTTAKNGTAEKTRVTGTTRTTVTKRAARTTGTSRTTVTKRATRTTGTAEKTRLQGQQGHQGQQ